MTDRRRLAVRVTPDAERQIRGGHPWLFDGSITSVSPPDGRTGDLAVVFDRRRRFLAVGLYDDTSPIRVRILHHGEPRTVDAAFLSEKVQESLDRRRRLVEDPGTTGYRVVHGENDGLPGMVIDRYGEVVVLKLYAEAWMPHLDTISEIACEVLSPSTVVLRLARNLRGNGRVDGEVLAGRLVSERVRYRENDLDFEADVVAGQKTGAFLDQRENRQRVREVSEGRRVLDLFACTGGFSVHAAAGGAGSVHSVDLSPGAIATTTTNMQANRQLAAVRGCRHTTAVADAEREMQRLLDARDRFDLVIVDPPSFAQRSDQRAGALRAYRRLARRTAHLVEPGGLVLLASCSSRVSADNHLDAVERGVADAGRTLVAPVRTAHPLDHPVGFPEGTYLKAVLAEVVPSARGSRGITAGRRSPGRR